MFRNLCISLILISGMEESNLALPMNLIWLNSPALQLVNVYWDLRGPKVPLGQFLFSIIT